MVSLGEWRSEFFLGDQFFFPPRRPMKEVGRPMIGQLLGFHEMDIAMDGYDGMRVFFFFFFGSFVYLCCKVSIGGRSVNDHRHRRVESVGPSRRGWQSEYASSTRLKRGSCASVERPWMGLCR